MDYRKMWYNLKDLILDKIANNDKDSLIEKEEAEKTLLEMSRIEVEEAKRETEVE